MTPSAGLLAQGQYDLDPLPFPEHVQYPHYGDQIGKRYPQMTPHPACAFQAWIPSWAGLCQGPGGAGCLQCPGVGSWLSLPFSWGLSPIVLCSLTADSPDYYDYQGKGLGSGGEGQVRVGGLSQEGANRPLLSPSCRGKSSALRGGAVPVPVPATSGTGSHPCAHSRWVLGPCLPIPSSGKGDPCNAMNRPHFMTLACPLSDRTRKWGDRAHGTWASW